MSSKQFIMFIGWLSQWLLWVFFASNAGYREVLIGAVVSAISICGAARFRKESKDHFHLRARDVIQIFHTPRLVLVESWLLLRVVALRLIGRQVTGSVVSAHFKTDGDNPESRGRRALATTFLTLTPNTLVLGFLGKEQQLLFHTVLPQELPEFAFQMGATLDAPKRTAS
jgi:multisubunit Na+/H+ antiporter MnhE subunit